MRHAVGFIGLGDQSGPVAAAIAWQSDRHAWADVWPLMHRWWMCRIRGACCAFIDRHNPVPTGEHGNNSSNQVPKEFPAQK